MVITVRHGCLEDFLAKNISVKCRLLMSSRHIASAFLLMRDIHYSNMKQKICVLTWGCRWLKWAASERGSFWNGRNRSGVDISHSPWKISDSASLLPVTRWQGSSSMLPISALLLQRRPVFAQNSMIPYAVKMEVLTPMPVKQGVLVWVVVMKIVHGDKDMQLY